MSPQFKKGCLISVLVFVVLLILLITIITWQISKSYGLSRAPYIPIPDSFSDRATCQIVLRIPPASPILERVLPWEQLKKNTPIPLPQTTIPMALPYELGFWATTEFARNKVSFTLAINEKRLGPIAYEILQSSQPWKNIQQIEWDKNGLQFPQRGYLSLSGSIKIPEGVEEHVLQDWKIENKPIQKLDSQSKHLCEIQMDLTNGDFLVWTACIMNAQGINWEEELKNNKFAGMIYEIAKKLRKLNIIMDTTPTPDEMDVKVSLQAEPEAQGQLEFFLGGMGFPMLQDYLKNQFGMTLEGKLSWDSNQNALTGNLKLKNYENFLRTQLASFIK
ncbi:MAG TPA: hypothetical protein PLA12_01335 [Candidatus Hydrogenedens sp.]|nr:hypothetical protein [Candidatus Hydrogenedens sp.]